MLMTQQTDTAPRRGLNGNILKLIAIIAMTIDHLTWAFFPGMPRTWYVIALHIIGRLTAPIMWFFLAEGSYWTRNPKKYVLRLGLFAIVSHFAYCFAFGIPLAPAAAGAFNRTSVLWSLVISAALIWLLTRKQLPGWAQGLVIAAACLLSFPSDWSSVAVMCPLFLYMHRGSFRRQAWDIVLWSAVYAAVYIIFIDPVYGIMQMATALSIPLLRQYNGERGSWKGMKWFFYLYYPAHLVVVGFVRLAVQGDVGIIF